MIPRFAALKSKMGHVNQPLCRRDAFRVACAGLFRFAHGRRARLRLSRIRIPWKVASISVAFDVGRFRGLKYATIRFFLVSG